MKIQSNSYPSIEQLQDQLQTQQKSNVVSSYNEKSFQEILAEKEQEVQKGEYAEVKFSKHASNRLQDRNIVLTSDQVQRLAEGTQRAGEKGIKDSLVVMDKLAFIVNIPNNTVITAMDQMETKENIFTNIDGAVIV
jgi:flagellar operon protein